ncbi:MAG: AzlD domain-containing protein [Anaerolineales bacterium]
MNEFLLIAGIAVATMATRIPVLLWLSRRKLPKGLFRALKYVPGAVLSAIIFPAVLLADGKLALQADNAPLAASVIAALVSWRTRSLLLTIILGMITLFLWKALSPA